MPVYMANLGRFSLYISRYVRILRCWFNILNTNNIILSVVYRCVVHDCKRGFINCVSNVNHILFELVFGNVWNRLNDVNR